MDPITIGAQGRLATHTLAYSAVMVGGLATGFIIAGTPQGAAAGALVHASIFSFVGAIWGSDRLSTSERWWYAVAGVASGAGAYAMVRKRRRR